uniref:Uncharacterized protein n=1 Tax=Ceratitis capitata TaxID=7213 RepID=W8B1W6_CERCA
MIFMAADGGRRLGALTRPARMSGKMEARSRRSKSESSTAMVAARRMTTASLWLLVDILLLPMPSAMSCDTAVVSLLSVLFVFCLPKPKRLLATPETLDGFFVVTVGFFVSTGGGVIFVFSSRFSKLFRNSLDRAAAVLDDIMLLVVVVVVVVNPPLFVNIVFVSCKCCCCCCCNCCFFNANRLLASAAFAVKSKFLFSNDLRCAATLPLCKPVSESISLSESYEPKLSLRLELCVDELLPDFLMSTFDEVPAAAVCAADVAAAPVADLKCAVLALAVVVAFAALAVRWGCCGSLKDVISLRQRTISLFI